MPLLSLFFIISFNPGDLDAWEQSKPRCPSPRHPSAGCLTEILSCGVPFEKFSWCNKSGNFRINGFEICTVSQGACVCIF